MTKTEARAFIAANKWTFAKTMANIPHEWLFRGKCTSDALFVEFVEGIRRAGYDKAFGRKVFRYLDLDGFSYWTMGNPIEETTIINRAAIKPEQAE